MDGFYYAFVYHFEERILFIKTMKVSIYLTESSPEISQLAEKLGGICAEENDIRDGIEWVFNFSLDSLASQFHAAAILFPEVISIGRTPMPKLIAQAIADSRLCNCGWTTRKECNLNCTDCLASALEAIV